MTTSSSLTPPNQLLNFQKLKNFEHQLDDVMELIDTDEIKKKLSDAESSYTESPSELNQVRLGIVYHEVALNLSFLSKTEFKGYAQKSFDTLSELHNRHETTPELRPFIASYRASALALMSAETRKLRLLGQAFDHFEDAVKKYAAISYVPEFLRGSVAENLPWFFFSKRKTAKLDFQSIVQKYENNNEYAGAKIMSFTYWAWAKQQHRTANKVQVQHYLETAISLDPNYTAARKRAEDLRAQLLA